MALVEIQVPDIGDFDEVGVIELLVKPGDTVKAEQSLITVESDKASMEIPSSHAGVVKDLRVQVGDKVKQGSVVLTLEVVGAVSESNSTPAQSQQAQAAIEKIAIANACRRPLVVEPEAAEQASRGRRGTGLARPPAWSPRGEGAQRLRGGLIPRRMIQRPHTVR